MHGVINRSIQNHVCDSYGPSCWAEATRRAGLEFTEFEAMLSYADDLTPRLIDAVCEVLERSRPEVMEDLGTYLVSHPTYEAVRRLLRFGGVNFSDFLHSLDDLPDRAKLALADLVLPNIELREHDEGRFSLICDAPVAGYGHLMMGVLRVMADDYGALVLLDHTGRNDGVETLTIKVVEADYSAGRSFDLGARA